MLVHDVIKVITIKVILDCLVLTCLALSCIVLNCIPLPCLIWRSLVAGCPFCICTRLCLCLRALRLIASRRHVVDL